MRWTAVLRSNVRTDLPEIGQRSEERCIHFGLDHPIVCQNVDRSNTTQLIIPTMKSQAGSSGIHLATADRRSGLRPLERWSIHAVC
jgi:hypothetical protein